jgi:hypothetical protein
MAAGWWGSGGRVGGGSGVAASVGMAEKNNEPQSPEGQLTDNQPQSGPAIEEDEPAQKVTAQASGAKRDSYFKKRDYE